MGKKQYKRKNAEGADDWHARSRKPNLAVAEFKEGGESKDPNAAPKRKVALIISYNGTGYFGLQVQPDVVTIESVIFAAMYKAGGVSEDNRADVSKIGWSRCARTDKGVHAAANVISLKLVMKDNIVELINQHLPEPVRVMHLIRVGKKFNPKSAATSRAYLYLVPSFAFSAEPLEEALNEQEAPSERWGRTQSRLTSFRISEENKERLNALLKTYVGTKNYHNFTTTTDSANKSNIRFMKSFGIDAVLGHEGVEFVRLKVHGQSFMLHQIRKMVGLIISIFRGIIPAELLTSGEIFSLNRKRVPTAPALGLLLDRPFFEGYDAKVTRDKQGDQLEKETFAEAFATCESALEAFKSTYIIRDILQAEVKTFACIQFLEELRATDQHWGLAPVDVTRYKPESEAEESEDEEGGTRQKKAKFAVKPSQSSSTTATTTTTSSSSSTSTSASVSASAPSGSFVQLVELPLDPSASAAPALPPVVVLESAVLIAEDGAPCVS